jgi:hypothetical protein
MFFWETYFSYLISIEIRVSQLTLVIQHLLKMWNMPFCICGVTVKTLKGKNVDYIQ